MGIPLRNPTPRHQPTNKLGPATEPLRGSRTPTAKRRPRGSHAHTRSKSGPIQPNTPNMPKTHIPCAPPAASGLPNSHTKPHQDRTKNDRVMSQKPHAHIRAHAPNPADSAPQTGQTPTPLDETNPTRKPSPNYTFSASYSPISVRMRTLRRKYPKKRTKPSISAPATFAEPTPPIRK